ncbi:unnamed protein product [Microthlaspi erraticum]|uniref:Uncharacterized protein n=1 Tax=Microthlaspi erraticum TaxID=1685480 RepID=A0A6D2KJ36_9BRAS|nr:unnamed protein product [Microthlaspi erraticum]
MGKTNKTDMVNPDRYLTRAKVARNKAAREISLKKAKKLRDYIAEDEDKYWDIVWKYDGFDVEHVKEPCHCLRAMQVIKCKPNEDCPLEVTLYAKMGLHRYNMIQGTDLKLDRIQKYNKHLHVLPSTYYITLVAWNPATGTRVPFQTSIHEIKWNVLDVQCRIARLKEKRGTKAKVEKTPGFYHVVVPKWPEDDVLADQNRFYVVPESEWQENDWIILYLQLAFVTTNRYSNNLKLSDLKIVEVMVETKENVEPPSERLKGFKDAVLYIKYDQDLGEGQVSKRRAIITRDVDSRSGHMSLIGKIEDPEQHEASI